MISKVYESIISENFNILDNKTRHTLLTINESDQNKVLESLTSKLYQSIMDKVDDIDFGSIPNSKGDITLIQNYEQLLECIGVIKNILIEYKQDQGPVNTIQEAISNIQERTDMWKKSFSIKLELPILTYNSIVLAIISSVSLIIATSIEFIKDAGDAGFDIKFDKVSYVKTRENLLFDNLTKFNSSCRSGELDRSLEHIFKNGSRQLMGVDPITIVSVVAIVGIITNIIPILRELVFFYYNNKQKVSDYFTIQADLLQMNAEYVKQNPNSDLTASEKKDVAKKQYKFVELFRKLGNTLSIDIKTSEAKAKKDIESNKKKYNIDDVIDYKLDSAEDDNSSIF